MALTGEIISGESTKKCKGGIDERDRFQDQVDCLIKDAVSRILTMDASLGSSTPLRKSAHQVGCETPLSNLLSSFSPSVVKYVHKQDDVDGQGTIFKYVQKMSPSTVSLSVLATNCNEEMLPVSESDLRNPSGTITKRQYYPGSMLAGNSEASGCLPELDNYLNADENSEEIANQIAASSKNRPSFCEEVISSSEEQLAWQRMNPINPMISDSVLAPVMLSSYEDLLMLQQQLINENMQQQQQYILPVFLQPVMMGDEEKLRNKSTYQNLVPKDFENAGDPTDQEVPKENNKVADTWEGNLLTDEELLSQCKGAACSNESPEKSVNTTDSMKFLEEAAVRLLQDGASRKAKKPPAGNFQCHFCFRKFRRAFTMNSHMRIHTGDKPFVCEICGKGFRQSGTKLNHMRAVHTKEKPFKCSYCGKKFSHKSSVTVHTRIHTKEKPYECTKCARKFTDRATFLKHQTTHSALKPFRCPLCATVFSQKSNLKRHFRNVHELEKEEIDELSEHSSIDNLQHYFLTTQERYEQPTV